MVREVKSGERHMIGEMWLRRENQREKKFLCVSLLSLLFPLFFYFFVLGKFPVPPRATGQDSAILE